MTPTLRRAMRHVSRPFRQLAALAVLAALVVPTAGAQSQTGTTIGQFLLIEPSAEYSAQGNAAATARGGVLAMYYNPGALGFSEGVNAAFTHSPWLADIAFDYAAVSVPLGANQSVSLAVTSLNSGDMDVRTETQPQGTGERFSVRDLSIGLGYGRQFSDRFAGGLQVKYISERIWNSSASAVALDAGVIYELPFQAVLGASISNFSTRTSFDGRDLRIRFDQNPDEFGDNDSLPASLETDDFSLPVYFRVGLSYPVEVGGNSRVVVSADAFQPSDNSNSLSLGGEWTYAELVSLRGGYQNLFLEDGRGRSVAGRRPPHGRQRLRRPVRLRLERLRVAPGLGATLLALPRLLDTVTRPAPRDDAVR